MTSKEEATTNELIDGPNSVIIKHVSIPFMQTWLFSLTIYKNLRPLISPLLFPIMYT